MAKSKSYKKRLPKYAPGGETDDPRKRMIAEAAKRKSSVALPDISFVQPSGKETGYLKEEEKKKKVAKREADIARVMKNPAIKSRKQAEDFLKMKAKEAYRGPDRLSETPEEQSSIGKFVDVAAHPGLALDIYRTTGTLPDYFAEKPIPGVTGLMDFPYSFTGLGTAAGIAKASKDLPSEIMEGDLVGMGTNLFDIAPGLRNIKGISKTSKDLVKKGVGLSKNLGTMAYQRTYMPSNVAKIQLSDLLDDQKIADKVSKIAEEQSTLYRGIASEDPELAKTFLTTPGGTGQGVYGSPYSRVYVSNAGLGSTAEGYTYGQGYVGKLQQELSGLEGKTPLEQLKTLRGKGQNYNAALKLDKSKVDDVLSSATDDEEKQFILNQFQKLNYKVSPKQAREIFTQAKNPDRLLNQAKVGLKEGERIPQDIVQRTSKKIQEQQKLTLNKPGPLEAHQVLADEVQANLFKAHGKEFFEHDISNKNPYYAHRTYIDPKLKVVEQTPIFDYNPREGSRIHQGVMTPGAAPAYTHITNPIKAIDYATPEWAKLAGIAVPALGVTGALMTNVLQDLPSTTRSYMNLPASEPTEQQIKYDPKQQSSVIPQQKYGGYMAGRLNKRKGLPTDYPRYTDGGFNWLSLAGPAIGLMGAFQQPQGQMDYGTSDYFQEQNQAEGQSKAATAAIAKGLSFVPGWGQAASLGLQGAQALSGLVGQKDAYGMAPTGFQQGASALLDPVGSLVSAAHGQNPFSRKEKMREVGSLYQDMSKQKTTDQQDAYTQNVKAAEGQYLAYGGYMPYYALGGRARYFNGGRMANPYAKEPNAEIENEVVNHADGGIQDFSHLPRHENATEKNLVNMEDGSFVFSNRIKNPATGNYFAKDAKPLNTSQQEKILADGNTTPLTKNSAKLMFSTKKILADRLAELHEATKIYNGAQKAENEATEEFIGMLGGMYGKGGLIKRKDGSYSPRGLWDNIRANRGSGKKPTKAMLEQERKIKAKYDVGGNVDGDPPYITKLNPQEEIQFKNWYEKLSKYKGLSNNPDNQYYDMRGYWKENPNERESWFNKSQDVHFTDKYKQPGHPTFSNESIYSNEKTPGGTWTHVEKGNKWYYHPSKYTSTPEYKRKTIQYLRENYNNEEPAFPIYGKDTINVAPLMLKEKAMGGYMYADGGTYVTAGDEYHRIYKNAEGDIMVNHPKEDKGKWDTINLTNKAGAKTVAQGVAATKKWHRENPEYAYGGYALGESYDLSDAEIKELKKQGYTFDIE